MISILDYGAGNLRSVENTLGAIGAKYELVRDADALTKSTKIILPGVGHFGQMMRALDEMGVRDTLVEGLRAGLSVVREAVSRVEPVRPPYRAYRPGAPP